MSGEVFVSVAVEGESDRGVVDALLAHVSLALARPCLVKRGTAKLDGIIPGLARTTIHHPWIVFRDADRHCPVALREELIGPHPHDGAFELRLACSMMEAWLLADADGFSRFFHVPMKKITDRPDDLEHAKRELLRLCRHSRSSSVRRDVVRRDGSPGPEYVARINGFAREHWNVERARDHSPSLERAIGRLELMREQILQAQDRSR
ncbi:hypothetical protein IR146_00860 [Actinomyces bowdenii]|uniref:DUF4276 family protein n=1 Tax=Actinomyces bowdenii TaxID=131109 RepID=A0A853EIS8_9ACTO|nr:hypothetical protein [Actinomyces bowdenii]NYS68102.1 hypothetical protein [Actinomyces bowdenii]